jgi:GNAT superfamily N-acetyltransferase
VDLAGERLTATAADLGLALRRETDDDRPFLEELYATTRWDEPGIAEWPSEPKTAFLRQQFGAQYAHYNRAYRPRSDFRILERDGRPVGRLYLFATADDVRIVDISLLPAERGQGVGGRLLQAVIDDAHAGGRTASIHVEEFNPAQKLYRRLGFREVSQDGLYILMRTERSL